MVSVNRNYGCIGVGVGGEQEQRVPARVPMEDAESLHSSLLLLLVLRRYATKKKMNGNSCRETIWYKPPPSLLVPGQCAVAPVSLAILQ